MKIVGLIFTVVCSVISYSANAAIAIDVSMINSLQTSRLTSLVSTKNKNINITAKKAARIARNQIGGKVLKVKYNNGVYRIKLLKNNGHIIWMRVDAKTGSILR